MMSKTHLSIGIGTALLVTMPHTMLEYGFAIAGGAIGGVVADNDVLDKDTTGDAIFGQVTAFAIAALVVAADIPLKYGLFEYYKNGGPLAFIKLIAGCVLFVYLYSYGYKQEHRTFTHSIIAHIVFTLSFLLICQPAGYAFLVAYGSHIILDLFNKRDNQLFWPLKVGVCFRLCYADRKANKVLMIIGFAITILFIIRGLIMYFFSPGFV